MHVLLSPVAKPPVRFSRFAGSFIAHIVLLATTVVLSRYAASYSDEIDWSRFYVEPYRLHESVPVFFAPLPERATLAAGGAARARRASKAGPTVLEPEYLPDAKLPATVPPLAHWSRIAPPDTPKPAPRQIITAGRPEADPAGPQLTRPSLSVPNRETAVGDVNISLPQGSSPHPAVVTFANSSTMLIQAPASAPARAASFDMSIGDPVNVLALSENRTVPSYVEIARGLQNVPASDVRDDAAPGQGSRAGASGGARPGTPGSPAHSPDLAGSAVRATEAANPSRAADVAVPQSEMKRVSHPTNGSYDVVVAQSATLHDSSMLNSNSAGGPVYTVYLPVGDEKEWLLEFCGAAAPRVPQSAYQITVSDESPIAAPYPISTVIPTKLLATLTSKLVLRGSITSTGRLSNFQLNGPASVVGDAIVKLLEEWLFRPARRDTTPIDVDVLLIIPPRR